MSVNKGSPKNKFTFSGVGRRPHGKAREGGTFFTLRAY